jgi:putative ABC transport system permease protein
MLVLRIALKGLKSNQGFAWLTAFNVAFGVLSYLAVVGFNDSFLARIRSNSQSTASADIVTTSRIKPSEETETKLSEAMPVGTEQAKELVILTMAASSNETRLVEVRFIDHHFPMYGSMKLRNGGLSPPGVGATISNSNRAWIYPELLSQLKLKQGDDFKIGSHSYIVSDVVDEDPTASGMGFSIAPRIYVDLSTADATGFLVTGSRIQWITRFKVPAQIDSDKLEQKLKAVFQNDQLRIRSHKNASEELGRLQKYLNDYLSLIALAALFLSTVGTSYMLRGYLINNIKEFAVLMSLGAKSSLPVRIFLIQATILGLSGSFLGIALSRLALPLLARLMEPITGEVVISALSLSSILVATIMAVGGAVFMAIPLTANLARLRPGFLFREASLPTLKPTFKNNLLYLPAIFLWLAASIYQSGSVRNGGIFAGGFMLSAVLIVATGYILLRYIPSLLPSSRLGWKARLALTQISRNPLAAMSSFLALALGTALLNVIPQLRASVSKEIERPNSLIPQLFMFDIQDDQIEELKSFFLKKSYDLSEPSPMIRARFDMINAAPVSERKMNLEGERDQEQRENLQARMQNLSFRSTLGSSEQLVEGTLWNKPWDGVGVPAISLEQEFARRLAIRVGDILTFDISGVVVEGKVESLRKVRWTSFQPNFFIVFQPGVLEDAPKVWVASASGIADDRRLALQSELVDSWPNISVVDVKATVLRLLTLIDQISQAIGFVSILSLAAGFSVFFAIASYHAKERRLTFALLKTLGAGIKSATQTTLIEYGLIAGAAVLLGTFLSFGLSYLLTSYVFKATWWPNWFTPLFASITIFPTSVALAWLAVRQTLKVKVVELLK